MIVHLNGWPGVGKQTIGRIAADRLGARFIHNHVLHDVAIACTGIADAERWDLYEEVRRAAYERLRRRPRAEAFVMTNALCVGRQREVDAWNHVVDLAIGRGVPLIPIILTADVEENVRRFRSPERIGRKMTDAAGLRSALSADRIQSPNVRERAVLDVTLKSPDEAADDVVGHVRRVAEESWLAPATDAHRLFRD